MTMKRAAVLVLATLAGCGTPLTRESIPLDAPRPEEAKVVVYRPSGKMAEKLYPVYDGESLVGLAESWGRFEFFCPPGKHLFWVSGARDTALAAELAGGRTYTLQMRLDVTFLALKPVLVPVTDGSPEAEELAEDLEDCELRELVPETAALYRERRLERIAEARAWFEGEGKFEVGVLRPADGK